MKNGFSILPGEARKKREEKEPSTCPSLDLVRTNTPDQREDKPCDISIA
jgi:hypothetical protein